MSYEKRVCVLKQIKKGFSADGNSLSGAVYCERLGDALTVTPRLIGIAPVKEGRYALVLRAEGKTLVFALRGNESLHAEGAPSIKNGFSALLAYVRGDAEPVAFGACGSASADYAPLLSALGGGEKKQKIPTPLSPFETPAPVAPNVPRAPGVPLPSAPDEEDPKEESPFRGTAVSGYDDEAIAEADYFSRADGEAENAQKEEGQAEQGGGDPQTDAPAPLRPRGSLTYYREIREHLERAFTELPRDERLKEIFPQSEWVRKGDALIGIVFSAGNPRYLCVAVEKEGPAPAEMGTNALFVPLAGKDAEGFWIVFQDADTGEYVTVSLA